LAKGENTQQIIQYQSVVMECLRSISRNLQTVRDGKYATVAMVFATLLLDNMLLTAVGEFYSCGDTVVKVVF